jgi:hypothetical protein
MKKKNTWNIRCLVDESFVPATQQHSDPAYHIEDCPILLLILLFFFRMEMNQEP